MLHPRNWPTCSQVPALLPGQLHVWRIPLVGDGALRERRTALLSDEERARMGRFHFERDRHGFALKRGALRLLLGGYLGDDPRKLAFRAGEWGKPEVAGLPPPLRLQFNVSDSGEWALLAVVRDARVGVDIERLRPVPEIGAVARDHFSQRELAQLEALEGPPALTAFFNCWTRKEAWLKGTGRGLSLALDSFDVSLLPGDPPRLLRVDGEPAEPQRWWMVALDPAPGYVGAAALDLAPRAVLTLQFG